MLHLLDYVAFCWECWQSAPVLLLASQAVFHSVVRGNLPNENQKTPKGNKIKQNPPETKKMEQNHTQTDFHANLDAALVASPNSIADLATKSGISEQSLRRLVRARGTTPQKRTVNALESALGLPNGSLLKKRTDPIMTEKGLGPIMQAFEARITAMERRIEALERAAIANLR